MQVELRNPTRTIEFDKAMSVAKLLNKLELERGSVLVICDGTLVPYDAMLSHDAIVEVRSVISGGSQAQATGQSLGRVGGRTR